MSEAATGGDGNDEILTVNFKVTESFLREIDETWQGRGFNSRSEFICYTLRDGVEFPTNVVREIAILFGGKGEGGKSIHDSGGNCRIELTHYYHRLQRDNSWHFHYIKLFYKLQIYKQSNIWHGDKRYTALYSRS